jgi:hypothetical protein
MFVSHALLHGGLLHLGMNAAVLLGLGRLIGDRYGAGTMLPLFLLSAIAGGAAFALLNVSDIPMVGASGAVFGFLGVWTAWDWHRHRAHGVSTRPVVMRGGRPRPRQRAVLLRARRHDRLGGASRRLRRGPRLRGFWLERELASAARRARAEARRRERGEP